MERIYKGLRENGQWDEFVSTRQQAEPQNCGYDKVVDAETGEEIVNTNN